MDFVKVMTLENESVLARQGAENTNATLGSSLDSLTSRTKRPKLHGVQALRGFAISYIVLFHAGNIFHYRCFIHGATGLGLFFGLSGFVIGYAHRSDRGVNDAIVSEKKDCSYLCSWILFFTMLVLFLVSGKGGDYHRDPENIVRNALLI